MKPTMSAFRRFSCVGVLAAICCCAAHGNDLEQACAKPEAVKPFKHFDAAQLREGRFTYQLTAAGENLGTAVIEIRRTTEQTFRITFDSVDIDQHWMSEFDTHFRPVAARLVIGSGESGYRMSLAYAEQGVTGEEVRRGARKSVSQALRYPILDQRVDWAAMMIAPFPTNESFRAEVYDPGSAVSALIASSSDSPSRSSVLGMQQATRVGYVICKKDHVESYVLYTTRDAPRVMLREEMPNQLIAELVKVEP